MKTLIKKLIPKFIFKIYHLVLAYLSAFVYGFPSNKLIVIGVTGTNGKTTTANLLARGLEVDGIKTGMTSTVNFKVGDKEWLNDRKMTMLGRFQLQKMLKEMVSAGCRYAIIETSSQGVEQFRHLGINYDYLIFTNLTPEHIEAHGGFENYQKAKGKLFSHLTKKKTKNIFGHKILKTILVNIDDQYSDYFLNFPAQHKIGFTCENKIKNDLEIFGAQNVSLNKSGTSFDYKNEKINLKLLGAFNVYNVLPTLIIAEKENLNFERVKQNLEKILVIPGRMELIDEGQDFAVLVDYAPEPFSLTKLYESLKLFPKNKIIHVLGSCGGGRDVARRPIMGELAGKNADFVIITNEDPYDDDPLEIINDIFVGAVKAGKILDENVFKILDRREGIKKAILLAKSGDLVLITGKGAEQKMAVANEKYLPWDDRVVVREQLSSS
ncbi:MAG: UDP-N-acetylmuramoyl-L-alanyl-D-glutamate--2,6-diaminopimelate ligase [Patescibacteria group bacterium]